MGLISFALSAGLIVAVCLLAQSRRGYFAALALSFGAGILLTFILLNAVWIQSFATGLILAIAAPFRPKRPFVIGASFAAAIIGYAVVFPYVWHQLTNTETLRLEFPVISLRDRLAFEQHKTVERDELGRPRDVALAERPRGRLKEFERRSEGRAHLRAYYLRRLHNNTYRQFVTEIGFGNTRMGRVWPESVRLPPAESISLPEPPVRYESPFPVGTSAQDRNHNQAYFEDLHDHALVDMFDPMRRGYIESKERVIGFQSHRLTRLPRASENNVETTALEWQPVRLELISLLKHDPPVAYVSQHLPNMEEFINSPTRELSTFERSAVGGLSTDQDVVFADEPMRIRMVGAIRAARDCLECHAAQHGELLGAFSYELTPVVSSNKPSPAEE